MGIKIIATNKKAYHDYFIDETYEAGLVLTGTEVKSLRAGNVNLKEAFCRIVRNEVFINNMHISPYEHGNIHNVDPTRVRKLLLHRAEIAKLVRKVEERGFSLVPTKLYFKDSRVKLELGVARGKKLHDKRETLKRKEADREMAKAVKSRGQDYGKREGGMAKILVMHGDRVLKEIQLSERELKVGRDPGNDIHLDNPLVSRFHAEIYRQGCTVYVEDKQSTNGTFLNGKFLNWKSGLNHNDTVTIGRHVLKFLEDGKEESTLDDACQTVFMSGDELKRR